MKYLLIAILCLGFCGCCVQTVTTSYASQVKTLASAKGVLKSTKHKYKYKATFIFKDGTKFYGEYLTNNDPRNEEFYIMRSRYILIEDNDLKNNICIFPAQILSILIHDEQKFFDE